jgi:membrane-bound acyltransferase YfiQ involved in biofilm formation
MAELAEMRTAGTVSGGRERHLYEVDVIRAVTALSVVAVHTAAFTIILTTTPAGQLVQSVIIGALHYTREIFLSITAFVMVYGYARRPFSGRTFWKKRGIGVLLPYVLWSFFYEFVMQPPLPPGPWILRALSDLVTGSASFQLYYILLTLELYLILPWFLAFIRRAALHPWRVLGISLAVQVILLAADYRYVQVAPFDNTPLGLFINLNQTRFLPLYQFYLVLGGLAALNIDKLRAFVVRYGHWTVPAVVVTLTVLTGNLIYQTANMRGGLIYGISVFQPAMPFYAVAVSLFLYWIAYRWAIGRAPRPPRGYKFWSVLSSASFGIYLLHAYVLNEAMTYLVPDLPSAWAEPLRVVLTWILVGGATAAVCSFMLYVPGLSRLIGHPCMLPRDNWISAGITAFVRRLGRITDLTSVSTADFQRSELTWTAVAGKQKESPIPLVSADTIEETPAATAGPMVVTRFVIESFEGTGTHSMFAPQQSGYDGQTGMREDSVHS